MYNLDEEKKEMLNDYYEEFKRVKLEKSDLSTHNKDMIKLFVDKQGLDKKKAKIRKKEIKLYLDTRLNIEMEKEPCVDVRVVRENDINLTGEEKESINIIYNQYKTNVGAKITLDINMKSVYETIKGNTSIPEEVMKAFYSELYKEEMGKSVKNLVEGLVLDMQL